MRLELDFMDPSVRKCAKADLLTLAIPITKFLELVDQMEESFLITDIWALIQHRME